MGVCFLVLSKTYERGATLFVTVTTLKQNRGRKTATGWILITVHHSSFQITMLMQRCVIRVSRVRLCCGKVPQAYIQSLSSSSCVCGLTLLSSLIPPRTYDKISSFSFVSPPCLTEEPSSSLAGPLFMKPLFICFSFGSGINYHHHMSN